jgi:hypothetical protein
MAVELSVTYTDINGATSTSDFSVVDAASANAVLPKLKALTNARITAANILTPLDITTIPANTAVAANNETVRVKMSISMSGVKPVGATATPKVRLGIPAPKGTYINGEVGDPTNADITSLLANIVSNRGEVLTQVNRVAYAK